MADIIPLNLHEIIKVDTRRVRDFVNELGEDAAERVVEQATTRLERMIRAINKSVLNLNLRELVTRNEQLSMLAWQIGLVSLSNVATDLGDCAEHNNIEALLVVNARLTRVGLRSLAVLHDAKGAEQG